MNLRKASRMLDDMIFVQRIEAATRVVALEVGKKSDAPSDELIYAGAMFSTRPNIDALKWACASDETVQAGAVMNDTPPSDSIDTTGVKDEAILNAIRKSWPVASTISM